MQPVNPFEVYIWLLIAILIAAIIVLISVFGFHTFYEIKNLYRTDTTELNLEDCFDELVQRRNKSSVARRIQRNTRFNKNIDSHRPYFSKKFNSIRVTEPLETIEEDVLLSESTRPKMVSSSVM